MPAEYVVDTNILIYSLDQESPDKRARATRIIERLGQRPAGALPAQVLAEFSNVALRRLEPPLPPQEVYTQVELYKQVFPIIPLTAAVALEAVRGVKDHGFSYYDAQIWAAARLNQVPTVLSEDFATGSTIEGVTFENPLAAHFRLEEL